MSSITYLRLDATNDPVFVPQASLTDLQAVAQAILTRISLFEGEWWENLNLGTPMFQSIIGSPGSPQNQQTIGLLIQEQILSVPYVFDVTNQALTYNLASRLFTYTATAQTSFGSVPITISPGSSASLGGA